MKQKLLTKDLSDKIPRLYATEDTKDPVILTRFFHPYSSWEWYPIEYDPDTRIFFGLVKGDFVELGYFSLDELEAVRVYRCPIERDLYFRPMTLTEVRAMVEY